MANVLLISLHCPPDQLSACANQSLPTCTDLTLACFCGPVIKALISRFANYPDSFIYFKLLLVRRQSKC